MSSSYGSSPFFGRASNSRNMFRNPPQTQARRSGTRTPAEPHRNPRYRKQARSRSLFLLDDSAVSPQILGWPVLQPPALMRSLGVDVKQEALIHQRIKMLLHHFSPVSWYSSLYAAPPRHQCNLPEFLLSYFRVARRCAALFDIVLRLSGPS